MRQRKYLPNPESKKKSLVLYKYLKGRYRVWGVKRPKYHSYYKKWFVDYNIPKKY